VPHVTIEYVILVPVLILQIFLFPFAASLIMNTWVDSRRTLALQEAASNLGSSMQQMYFSLNHTTISAGNVTNKLDIPPFIEGYAYTGTATLRTVSDPAPSSKVLEVTLRFMGVGISATTTVTLGQNVEWRDSTFMSNSTFACLRAEKYGDGVIQLSFGSQEMT
jgi:hypothetical protein